MDFISHVKSDQSETCWRPPSKYWKQCTCHVLRILLFLYILKHKQTKHTFLLCEVRVFQNLVDTFNLTKYTTLKSYFIKSIICLCFPDVNKCHQFVYILKKRYKVINMGIKWKVLTWGLRIFDLFIDFCVWLHIMNINKQM